MIAAEALRAAVARLTRAGVPDPARDARLLLAHAMKIAPDRVSLVQGDPMTEDQLSRFDAAVVAREARKPVSQITGRRAFWGRDFIVTSDVLDPRPETETLVALALQHPFARVLDLGTGSGAILLTLLAERPAAGGLGTDLSPQALSIARRNAEALSVTRAEFRRSDWFATVEGQFDLIVSNPPYIAKSEMDALSPEVREHEPHMALTPGGDGLDAYRAIAIGAPRALAPGGRLLVEIGATQGPEVAGILSGTGLLEVTVHPDLDGRDRVVSASAPSQTGA